MSHNFIVIAHDDVIKWKTYPRYWRFVWEIHRSPVNSPHKGQWPGAVMFSLIGAWTNGWINNQQLRSRWFETPSHPLWRHCSADHLSWNGIYMPLCWYTLILGILPIFVILVLFVQTNKYGRMDKLDGRIQGNNDVLNCLGHFQPGFYKLWDIYLGTYVYYCSTFAPGNLRQISINDSCQEDGLIHNCQLAILIL